jgi:hypothetical protein
VVATAVLPHGSQGAVSRISQNQWWCLPPAFSQVWSSGSNLTEKDLTSSLFIPMWRT